jgi:antitoxin PrlF
MEQRARVTSKGQVTVPKGIREALGVRAGDSLVFEVENGGAKVRVVREPVSFADYAGAWREGEGMTVEEVNAYVRDLRGHDDGRGG